MDSHGRSAGKGALIQEDLSATLAAAQDQTLFQPVCIGNGQVDQLKMGDKVGALNCMHDQQCVCEPQPLCIEMISTKNTVVDDGISPTLTARMGTGGNQVNAVCEKAVRWIVRRLTPKECERLQGYDLICGFDGWTDIGEWVSKGKRHKEANSPRYKALGNSIALPFWHWMFGNMAKYIPEDATLGSLFDGIGGFPLCWESIHGKGTARWASEIEEFPIAVTKIRFPEEESGETATTDEPTRNASDSESVAYTQGQFANYREGVGTLRSSGGDLGGGVRDSDTYQDTVGSLCYDDYKGPNRQYVDQDKLIIEMR